MAALPLTVLLFALVYMGGMYWLEGDPRGFLESIAWAAETITTTGYGKDSNWEHPLMVAFVIFVQFTGVLLVVLVFPVYLIPFFEERFEGRLPELPKLSGRILVYRYGPAVRQLARELEEAGLRPIVFEEDEATARRLQRRGIPVAYGSVDEPGTFDAFAQASAIVSNGPDDEDAAMILSVRARGFEGPIVALVSAPSHRKPMLLAGATAAYTPRHVLAAELCGRSDARISPRAVQLGKLGEHGRVFELRVHRDSPIAGQPAAQLASRVEGLRLVARVREDETLAPMPDGRILSAGTRVVVVVPENSREAVQELLAPETTGLPFVVFGSGELAQKVRQMLNDVGEETRLVAPEAGEGVDHVGDILDTKTLDEAGVCEAAAVVLAIENDAATLFAATMLQDYAPKTPLIAGVESSTNVERTRAAGADYAIALDDVTGRILAHHLLEKRRGDAGFMVQTRRVGALATAPSSIASILLRTGVVVLGRLSSDAQDATLELLADDAEVTGRDWVKVCASPATLRDYPG